MAFSWLNQPNSGYIRMNVHWDVLNVRRLHFDVHHARVCHLAVDHYSPLSSRVEHTGLNIDLSASVVVTRGTARSRTVTIYNFKVS